MLAMRLHRRFAESLSSRSSSNRLNKPSGTAETGTYSIRLDRAASAGRSVMLPLEMEVNKGTTKLVELEEEEEGVDARGKQVDSRPAAWRASAARS